MQGLELVAKLEAYRTARHVVAVLLGVVLIVEVVYIDTEAEALLDGVVQRSTEDQCRGVLQTTAPVGLLSSYACSETRADGVVAEPVILPALPM